jgi:hypothetical protein
MNTSRINAGQTTVPERRYEDRVDFARMLEEFGLSDWMLHYLMGRSAAEIIPFPRAVHVTLAPSPINGQGVFATQSFAAGEVIAPARIGGKVTPAGRYTNHAKNPNAAFVIGPSGDLHEIALRDINAGEEITNDYRLNARINYASVRGIPLAQVTREMVRDAVLARCADC